MRATLSAIGLALVLAAPAPAADPPVAPPAPLSLWRLDCGTIRIKQYGAFFSDTFDYPEGSKDLVASCYLIRHGDRYMLWDTGLDDGLLGRPIDTPAQTLSLNDTIVRQLARIGVRPEQIEIVGISHYHADHTGQAERFPGAKLLIGKADLDAVKATPPVDQRAADDLRPWFAADAKVVAATGDVDVFHDGRVRMLTLPGHTPGHSALLVRLASGPVMLTGDLYHFTEQVARKGVPPFNTDRADTLASMDRFDRIARNLKATIVIQHEPADVAKLPRFPQAAK